MFAAHPRGTRGGGAAALAAVLVCAAVLGAQVPDNRYEDGRPRMPSYAVGINVVLHAMTH
jgi:hypothetical protein